MLGRSSGRPGRVNSTRSPPHSTVRASVTAATAVVDMVYNILTLGDSTVRKITFSTMTVNVRPEVQKGKKRRKKAA